MITASLELLAFVFCADYIFYFFSTNVSLSLPLCCSSHYIVVSTFYCVWFERSTSNNKNFFLRLFIWDFSNSHWCVRLFYVRGKCAKCWNVQFGFCVDRFDLSFSAFFSHTSAFSFISRLVPIFAVECRIYFDSHRYHLIWNVYVFVAVHTHIYFNALSKKKNEKKMHASWTKTKHVTFEKWLFLAFNSAPKKTKQKKTTNWKHCRLMCDKHNAFLYNQNTTWFNRDQQNRWVTVDIRTRKWIFACIQISIRTIICM